MENETSDKERTVYESIRAAITNSSEQISSKELNELASALSKAQLTMPAAKKGKKGYNYKYADLAACIEAARQSLADNGLAISQPPNYDTEGNFIIVTLLLHNSGQWIKSIVKITPALMKQCNNLQQLGSGIKYLRRYAAAAIINLAEEDDDTACIQPTTNEEHHNLAEEDDDTACIQPTTNEEQINLAEEDDDTARIKPTTNEEHHNKVVPFNKATKDKEDKRLLVKEYMTLCQGLGKDSTKFANEHNIASSDLDSLKRGIKLLEKEINEATKLKTKRESVGN